MIYRMIIICGIFLIKGSTAAMVGGLFLWPALRYGTGYQTVWEIRPLAETPSSVHWRRFYY